MFHSKYKQYGSWDEFRAADFRFISKLYDIIPHKIFINDYFIQMGNNGANGNLIDL